MKLSELGLVPRILIGVCLGVVVALAAPELAKALGLLGQLFVAMLKAVAPLLVNTTRLTPAERAASRTLRVPTTLMASNSSQPTLSVIFAARCITVSTPSNAGLIWSRSARLARVVGTPSTSLRFRADRTYSDSRAPRTAWPISPLMPVTSIFSMS